VVASSAATPRRPRSTGGRSTSGSSVPGSTSTRRCSRRRYGSWTGNIRRRRTWARRGYGSTSGTTSARIPSRTCGYWPLWTNRRTTAARWVPTIRSRGATTWTPAVRSTRPAVTPTSPLWTVRSVSTCWAGSSPSQADLSQAALDRQPGPGEQAGTEHRDRRYHHERGTHVEPRYRQGIGRGRRPDLGVPLVDGAEPSD